MMAARGIDLSIGSTVAPVDCTARVVLRCSNTKIPQGPAGSLRILLYMYRNIRQGFALGLIRNNPITQCKLPVAQ